MWKFKSLDAISFLEVVSQQFLESFGIKKTAQPWPLVVVTDPESSISITAFVSGSVEIRMVPDENYRACTISPRGAKVIGPKLDKSTLSVGSYDFCPRNFCVFFGADTGTGLSSLPTNFTRILSFSSGT